MPVWKLWCSKAQPRSKCEETGRVHTGVVGVIRVGMPGRRAWEIGGDLLLSQGGNLGRTWYNQAAAEGVAEVRRVQ
jgi:hypothetical protein